MKRMLTGVLAMLALSALLGWAGEDEYRTAQQAGGVRAWSVAQWEAHYLEEPRP